MSLTSWGTALQDRRPQAGDYEAAGSRIGTLERACRRARIARSAGNGDAHYLAVADVLPEIHVSLLIRRRSARRRRKARRQVDRSAW